MGYTTLARWINTNGAGLDMLRDSIMKNHMGQFRGRWQLIIKAYRSSLSSVLGFNHNYERIMWTMTMPANDVSFVLIEDPMVASRAEHDAKPDGDPADETPPHYRNTLVTLSPAAALDQLLVQTKAPWVRSGQPTVVVDGAIFAIGTDWIVRAGNVMMPGGAVKGLLLEAEYLPLPNQASASNQTSELFSNFLTSLLPAVPDAKTVAVAVSDQEWHEVLCPEAEDPSDEQEPTVEDDDVYAHGFPEPKSNDWTGIDRDRRSAFMIQGVLRSEGLL
ncbi:hypothetical protein EXIGLDRAFT_827993 [Exidia glandulosa HHB12029]|uniref:Mediator of RNA polymerase II transcription subunit 20 n=1 Tax=Exidia glandulosa HHB12029 TaxID=1314781 RepID=A0A165QU06_EXIGL|nr:hypothetical protein EXIGLDRAFT_827993 [Exidia glandulosa HHB12029]